MAEAITLRRATATCPDCGHQIHQISATAEHARSVVVDAMENHIATVHNGGRRPS